MTTKKLTAKQKAFCDEYLIDLNATQAAIRAGYSKKTANRIASQNLSKAIIIEKLAKLKEKRSKRTEIDAELVLNGIAQVIEDAKAMKETEFGKTMTNHAAALKGYELLGKHLAMFTDKVAHEGEVKLSGFTIEGVK